MSTVDATELNDLQLDEVARRLDARRLELELARERAATVPPPPMLTGVKLRMAEQQDAARERRFAAAREAEQQAAAERQAERDRRLARWEAGRPAREKAQAELDKLALELAKLDALREPLARRIRELEAVTG